MKTHEIIFLIAFSPIMVCLTIMMFILTKGMIKSFKEGEI